MSKEARIPARGVIDVTTNMNCRIRLDGRDLGRTADASMTIPGVPFGKHLIEAETERHIARKEIFLGIEHLHVKLVLEEKGATLEIRSDAGPCTVRYHGRELTCPATLTDLKKGVHELEFVGETFRFKDRIRVEPNSVQTVVITPDLVARKEQEAAEAHYRNVLKLPEDTLPAMKKKLRKLDDILINETRFDVQEGIQAHRRLEAEIRKQELHLTRTTQIRKQLARERRKRIKRMTAMTVVIVIIAATGLYLWYRHQRNVLDEKLYHQAIASGIEADFVRYRDAFGDNGKHSAAVNKVLARCRADRQAFEETRRLGSLSGYRSYLERFGPSAIHAEEARQMIARLELMETFPTLKQELALILIPGGQFFMGAAAGDERTGADNVPRMVVVIKPFYLSAKEVTFDAYDRFCRDTARPLPNDAGFGRGNHPVINVSWGDAVAYCRWLSKKTGLDVRLPSEAEWEYACRAHTVTRYFWGQDMDPAYCISGQKRRGKTRAVASTKPNPFGLYDMSGNVYEWCEDRYEDPYNPEPGYQYRGSSYKFPNRYEKNGSGNPVFRAWGDRRVIRGGSFRSSHFNCSAGQRAGLLPNTRRTDLGFRIAVTDPFAPPSAR